MAATSQHSGDSQAARRRAAPSCTAGAMAKTQPRRRPPHLQALAGGAARLEQLPEAAPADRGLPQAQLLQAARRRPPVLRPSCRGREARGHTHARWQAAGACCPNAAMAGSQEGRRPARRAGRRACRQAGSGVEQRGSAHLPQQSAQACRRGAERRCAGQPSRGSPSPEQAQAPGLPRPGEGSQTAACRLHQPLHPPAPTPLPPPPPPRCQRPHLAGGCRPTGVPWPHPPPPHTATGPGAAGRKMSRTAPPPRRLSRRRTAPG